MFFVSILSLMHFSLAEPLVLQTEQAFAAHLSTTGLTTIGEAIQKTLPTGVTISAGEGVFDCSSTTQLNYQLPDWTLNLAIDRIDFLTDEDRFSVRIMGYLSSSETAVDLSGDCAVFEDLSETCDLGIGITPFSLDMDVDIRLENGVFVTEVTEPVFEMANITNPLSNCLVADAADTLLAQDPMVLSSLITELLTAELASVPASVEYGLDSVIGDLTVDQTVDLLGEDLDVLLEPSTVYFDEKGIVFGFRSVLSIDIEPSCVDLSLFSPPEDVDWPTFDGTVFGSEMAYDAGIFLGRHFMEQIFYAVWASGVMCIDVSEQAGLELTGDFASGFFGEDLGTLIGEDPLELQIVPKAPLSVLFSDDQPPISIVLDELSLVGFGELHGRRSRVLQVDISSELGVYVDPQAFSVDLDMPVDIQSFTLDEAYDEIIPSGYSEGVPALIDLAVGSLLSDDLLPTITVTGLFGLEIEALIWQPDSNQDWLGAHILLSTENIEPFPLEGCSASALGCGASGPSIDVDIDEVLGCNDVEVGCEGGSCAQQGGTMRFPAGRILGLFSFALVCFLRRRE